MRDIKFRVYRKSLKQMYPTSSIWKFNLFDCTYKDDIILMQYTGLKDKNGKEIYEGDILKTVNGFVTTVEYSRGMFCFDPVEDKYNRHALFVLIPFQIEIIGNIYETPELMEK